MELTALRAVVTGGASGLGAATARHLAESGAKVTIFDRDRAQGETMAGEIGATFAEVDVTSEESVAAGIAVAVAAMGGIDALVNCAGIATGERVVGRDGPHRLESFRRTIDINLVGSFNVLRLVAAEMAKNEGPERGVIINTASIAAFDGQKGQAAYAASKGGIAGMTLPLARDLATQGIRVCAIAPGIFGTPMMKGLPQDVQDSLAAEVTFPKRLGEPTEYAELAGFIIRSGYLNGEVIRLDGALRMR
ncbi:MAG: SDR family NAD(P)-dependent oxidoreductase [Rhodobacteraceae bacterium]|uniref:SDR family NAD(P)-dependent oxidoreductase n=1 Tax=Thioclava sp. L04-15 TaxID=1915318 RepID=UPI0009985830|nr:MULTISPECIES: SDR family NAD(P)-dependent oxidoreductase [unclassified Thioclava]MBD3805284.1 SDR family NAD(P)-dependent oxidoreductase [Thioclava sp.]OOY26763.1 3-hydroxyacyl-CoA dehydrogenase [Thioclava sp. L04-15]TNE87313.1 MAG: SDR family NAD(P)-dependent oxidoreductase [Paracoccaceae bacterium]TNF13080.1 MAG: SDR family NAD(P)-dependent oxidoreductase [Paracoccaceae bacterium]